jgi:predicted proteasome-type protease
MLRFQKLRPFKYLQSCSVALESSIRLIHPYIYLAELLRRGDHVLILQGAGELALSLAEQAKLVVAFTKPAL